MRSKSQKYIYYCRYNKKKPYRVIIYLHGERFELGTFRTYPEALEARNNKSREIGMRIPISISTKMSINSCIRESIKYLKQLSMLLKGIDGVSYNTVISQINQLTKMLNKY